MFSMSPRSVSFDAGHRQADSVLGTELTLTYGNGECLAERERWTPTVAEAGPILFLTDSGRMRHGKVRHLEMKS